MKSKVFGMLVIACAFVSTASAEEARSTVRSFSGGSASADQIKLDASKATEAKAANHDIEGARGHLSPAADTTEKEKTKKHTVRSFSGGSARADVIRIEKE